MYHNQLIEVVEAWDKERRSRRGRDVSISFLKRREMPFGSDFGIGRFVVLGIERDNPQPDSAMGQTASALDLLVNQGSVPQIFNSLPSCCKVALAPSPLSSLSLNLLTDKTVELISDTGEA